MKLNKTETAIIHSLEGRIIKSGCFAGKRMFNACKSLEKKGLVTFENMSQYIPPHRSQVRNSMGDYLSHRVWMARVTLV